METQILKVLQQSETQVVDSQKAEGGKLSKCTIVFQELGGKYENQYVATLLGNVANCRFNAGELVAVRLRFQSHEHNGQIYQDIMVQDICRLQS